MYHDVVGGLQESLRNGGREEGGSSGSYHTMGQKPHLLIIVSVQHLHQNGLDVLELPGLIDRVLEWHSMQHGSSMAATHTLLHEGSVYNEVCVHMHTHAHTHNTHTQNTHTHKTHAHTQHTHTTHTQHTHTQHTHISAGHCSICWHQFCCI